MYDFYIRIIKLICLKMRERKIDGWREKDRWKDYKQIGLILYYIILFLCVVL